jgi:hypothetical protein
LAVDVDPAEELQTEAGRASRLISPIGRSAAITFQVAFEAASSRLSQTSCVAPRMKLSARSSPLFQLLSR